MKINTKLKNLDEKNKVVIKNVVGAFIIRGIALILSLFIMPAYIRYFDNQAVLGVWFTMLSVLSWILSFDLGIGNGLRNKLVVAINNNDRDQMRKLITSALISISGVVLIIAVVGGIIISFLPWQHIFNIGSTISNKTIVIAMLICFVGIMLQFVFNIINSIYYALQLSMVNNLLSLISSILQLVFVLVVKINSLANKLIVLSIAHVFCMLLPLFVAAIVIFATRLKDCVPSFSCFSKILAKQVITIGGVFFYCQLMHMLMDAVNEFLISSMYLPENVVDYQIYYKLFTLPAIIISLAITPLWSMVTKAMAEGDFIWIKKIFFRIQLLVLLVALGEGILVLISQFIINIWLGSEAITVNFLYAGIFAFFGTMMTYMSVVETIPNGIGHLKTQSIIMSVIVVIKFILVLSLHKYFSWITIIAINGGLSFIYCIIMNFRVNKFIKKKIQNIDSDFII